MSEDAHPLAEHYRLLDEMFRQLLTDTSVKLPSSDAAWIEDFVEDNEFGVAFDHLVDVIKEQRVAVPARYLKQIADIGTRMKLDPKIWEGIPLA